MKSEYALRKLTFDRDKNWVSLDENKNIVFNIPGLAEDWTMGTAAGTIMSAPGMVFGTRSNANALISAKSLDDYQPQINEAISVGRKIDEQEVLNFVNEGNKIKTQYGFSCFPKNDPLGKYAMNVKPETYINRKGQEENYFDVAAHGNPTGVFLSNNFGAQKISPAFLAKIIINNPKYRKGQYVRLLSCETGLQENGEYCYAEELSNILGVKVIAPDGKLYVYPNGTIKVGRHGEGKMLVYEPNNRGRFK